MITREGKCLHNTWVRLWIIKQGFKHGGVLWCGEMCEDTHLFFGFWGAAAPGCRVHPSCQTYVCCTVSLIWIGFYEPLWNISFLIFLWCLLGLLWFQIFVFQFHDDVTVQFGQKLNPFLDETPSNDRGVIGTLRHSLGKTPDSLIELFFWLCSQDSFFTSKTSLF